MLVVLIPFAPTEAHSFCTDRSPFLLHRPKPIPFVLVVDFFFFFLLWTAGSGGGGGGGGGGCAYG